MENLEHHLLIASPRLKDTWFAKTVVLVVGHTDEGAYGLILNRCASETVSKVWADIGEAPCSSQNPVHVGGPADGPLMALHTDESFADLRVVPGVFLAVQRDNLEWIVQQEPCPFRLFVGAASWQSEQLEAEIEAGVWLVLPASKNLVFGPADELWKNATAEYARDFYRSIGVRHLPEDPRVN